MSHELSMAHRFDMNGFGVAEWPDGRVPWRPAEPPNVADAERSAIGSLRGCSYCGSMHPADVAAAIRSGAKFSWADRKYGWPHKAYGDGIPNPHAGMPEVRASASHPTPGFPREVRKPRFSPTTGERVDDYVTYTEEPKPASATTCGKFYSVHLQDATPDDRALIESHLGIAFYFTGDGHVCCQRISDAKGCT